MIHNPFNFLTFNLPTSENLFIFSVTMYGTSNVRRFPEEVEKMSRNLGMEVNFELCYYWNQLREKLLKNSTKNQYGVFIHILGNDARDIAINEMLNQTEKHQQAMELALESGNFLNKFAQKHPETRVFFSTLLYRQDGEWHEFLRKEINRKIKQVLNEVFHIISYIL